MAAAFRRAMNGLYLLCVIVGCTALVLISAIIPWAVFTRYVLNSAASWPEPLAVLLTIVLTFIGAAAAFPQAGRAPGPAPDGANCAVHDRVGRKPGRSDLAQHLRRLPLPVGRRHLLADSDWRPVPAPVHRRADLARDSA